MSKYLGFDLFDKACEQFKYSYDCIDYTRHCYNCAYQSSLLCPDILNQSADISESEDDLNFLRDEYKKEDDDNFPF